MGVFGALTTAVTGLRAQSFALENVSGNIANSQTTAFKRIDTSFEDLIPGESGTNQLAGNVTSLSRATNTVQGAIQTASISTYLAVNGDGYFVVEKPSSFKDNRPIFDGIDNYTRRGDFQTNKDGYLVNGAGYYLMGIPIDAQTGNAVGSVPQLLQFQNNFLPAQPTTTIDYRANLASYPLTATHDVAIPGSELLNPTSFSANPLAIPPQPAKITGTGATLLPDAAAVLTGGNNISGYTVPASGTNTIQINGTSITLTNGGNAAQIATDIQAQVATTGVSAAIVSNQLVLTSKDAKTAIDIGNSSTLAVLNSLGLAVGVTNPTNLLTQHSASAGQTMIIQFGANPATTITFGTGAGQVQTIGDLSAKLTGSLTGGSGSVNASNGNIALTSSALADAISVSGTANPLNFGLHTTSAIASNQDVIANDLTTFINESVGGGAVTAYDVSGSPVNIQLRWAKTDSSTLGAGHTDTWNMFYQSNSTASGTQEAWKNVGVNFSFDAAGQMTPQVPNVALNNVTVDGIALGNLTIALGAGGVTQFADPNGTAQVNLLSQNGFAAGSLQNISVNGKGRIVGAYSNGRTIDLAEISLASFTGANNLKRLDGGAFEVTDESGPAVLGASGQIVGSSLEGSNTDIADEFTKLIVTQQAYSANTRVITTSNTMVQDLLNMLR